MLLTKMTLMLLLKVSLYKKLMAMLPAPEGCSKDEEGSLSTTEVFFTPINNQWPCFISVDDTVAAANIGCSGGQLPGGLQAQGGPDLGGEFAAVREQFLFQF